MRTRRSEKPLTHLVWPKVTSQHAVVVFARPNSFGFVLEFNGGLQNIPLLFLNGSFSPDDTV